MRVYNTLSGKKEDFKTIEENKVGLYVCGVTVYDYCHVGHVRAYISFDAIYRYLEYKGYDVTYVRNFTDIDDKIIKRSNELNISAKDLTERYINAFYEDMRALKIKDATIEPKATEHIDDMIAMIQSLIDNGLAYESDGDVYYAVEKFSRYGSLSHRKLDELLVGVRKDTTGSKRSPLDFTLWKKGKEGEPTWPSPWSDGRPGWHIECSTMSTKYLGHTFDIHGGGKDLVFPHHENEIAQSEGATGEKYVNYWLHNGFVNIDGAKMSKSLGNFFTIRDILTKYHPEVIRFFILLNHYRSPINFTIKEVEGDIRFISLDEAEERLYNIYETLSKVKKIVDSDGKVGVNLDKEFTESVFKNFENCMEDDFNTAAALGEFSKLVKFLNEILNRPKTKMKNKKATFEPIWKDIEKIGSILAVFDSDPDQFVNYIIDKRLKLCNITRDEIEKLIEERQNAKKDKNYNEADRIRGELNNMGISVKDCPEGVEWCCVATNYKDE